MQKQKKHDLKVPSIKPISKVRPFIKPLLGLKTLSTNKKPKSKNSTRTSSPNASNHSKNKTSKLNEFPEQFETIEEEKEIISHLKNFNLIDKIKSKNKNPITKTLSFMTNSDLQTSKDISSLTDNANSIKIIDASLNQNETRVFKKIRSIHQISMTGKYSNELKINQDSYFIYTNFCENNNLIYLGVCDGHGYQGEEVSSFLKDNLPFELSSNLTKFSHNSFKDQDDTHKEIVSTFLNIKQRLYENEEIDKEWSGSTCSSLIITNEKLIIINLGDSRSIIGKQNDSELNTKLLYSFQLSHDHKPTVPEEAERILSNGGVIKQMIGEQGIPIGPMRVYMKEKNIPGLAMTRSFGDYYAACAGAISEPEIEDYYFEEGDKFIIVASDGLWEYMSNEEVVLTASKYYWKNDIVGCCETLYKEARKRWIIEEGDNTDDITIIVIFLD